MILITERFISPSANAHLVCLADNEIFIAKGKRNNPSSSNLDVICLVEADRLEGLQSDNEVREYYRQDWKYAVANDQTEDSLDDWIEYAREEEPADDEYYPGKDESGCDIFNYEYNEGAREFIDEYLSENEDIEVGTWEASGCYTPSQDSDIQIIFDYDLFKRFCPWFDIDAIEDDIIYE